MTEKEQNRTLKVAFSGGVGVVTGGHTHHHLVSHVVSQSLAKLSGI